MLLLSALPAHAAVPAKPAPVLMVFGDSLSAGYGLGPGQGWVDLLAARLATEGYEFRLVNASVSGETTAGGLARLPRALEVHRPAVVVLELGANDGLRGLPAAATRANLEIMVRLLKGRDVRVLLVGIRLPPNYGPRFTAAFDSMYRGISAQERVPLVPFLLEGVALQRSLMQADNLHPNERGQPRLLDNVWPQLRPLLRSAVPPRKTG
ncbi:MAG: arylesterase [Steroidobacteraceae bacterium]